MRYYLISGEASGDLYGAKLMIELRKSDSAAEFRCWGGDRMEAAGGTIAKHYRDLAFMGYIEVLANLRAIARNFKFCKKDILEWKPDVVILIDYPGFNLRMAGFIKQHGIPVFYYISPQIWAWKQSRIHKIKRTVDRMFVILPFEKDFYKKFNYPVDYSGHPLLDFVAEQQTSSSGIQGFLSENNLPDKPIIALLPGSRKQEISKKLPVMLTLVPHYPAYQFLIAGAPGIDPGFYKQYMPDSGVTILHGKTYPILQHAWAGVITSGTATLETALFNIPQVVCYKANAISVWIARKLVKIKYISLVNLILDREVVTELIQDEMNPERLKIEFDKIVEKNSCRENILNAYRQLHVMLGNTGASSRIALLMYNYLREKK